MYAKGRMRSLWRETSGRGVKFHPASIVTALLARTPKHEVVLSRRRANRLFAHAIGSGLSVPTVLIATEF